jgi:valyl-tRNA synthetase
MTRQWPSYDGLDSPEARAEMDWVVEFISLVRSIRQEIGVPAAPLKIVLEGASAESLRRLEAHRPLIAKIARLDSITVDTPVSGAAARLLLGEATLILPLEGVIDIAAEKARLSKEIGKLAGDIAKITGKLGNEAFVAKAPPEVIVEQRDRLAEAEAARAKLSEALARLG